MRAFILLNLALALVEIVGRVFLMRKPSPRVETISRGQDIAGMVWAVFVAAWAGWLVKP